MTDTLYDMEYDVCFDTQQELFAQIVACGLTLVSYIDEGPGGGNNCIVLRGSRESQLKWLGMRSGPSSPWNVHLEVHGVGIHKRQRA